MPFTWRSSESISQYIREVKSESVPDLLPNEPLSSSSCNIGIKASNEREQNSSGVTRFFPQFFFQKSVQSFVQKCNIIFRDSSFIKRQHYQRLHYQCLPYQWPRFLGENLCYKKSGHSGERRSQVRWNSESGTTTVLWQKTMAAAVAL